MKRKFLTTLTVLVLAMFVFSTADAGGGLKISGASFSLGSLIADGFLKGDDETTVTVVLTAAGSCTINEATVPVSAIGSQILSDNEETETQENQRPFHVETTLQNPQGCNNNTEGQDGFVFWKTSSISVYSGQVNVCTISDLCGGIGLNSSINATNNTILLKQDYTCTTDFATHTVSCTPVKGKGSSNSNGTTAICHATGSKKNPYVLLTVNGNGLKGHSKHAGDIIPAPAEGCPN